MGELHTAGDTLRFILPETTDLPETAGLIQSSTTSMTL